MPRDDFPQSTKTELAKRAGYRCSFPNCDRSTIGPSTEGPNATASTGDAAHISAAAGGPNARRYDPNLTPEQRSSIDNGIWCCSTHARLIDRDELLYRTDELKVWRRQAERRALLRQAHGNIELTCHPDLTNIGLAPGVLTLPSPHDINNQIGDSVMHACIRDVWGRKKADALRDFLIEHTRNAFLHGEATSLEISFEQRRVKVTDNGRPFDISALAAVGTSRGGGLAYRALLQLLFLSSFSSQTDDGGNTIYIPFVSSASELAGINPCAVHIGRELFWGGAELDLTILEGCGQVYVVIRDYVSFSDHTAYTPILAEILTRHPSAIFIFSRISEAVLDYYKEQLPHAKIISWHES